MMFIKRWILLLMCIWLIGCESDPNVYAPVYDVAVIEHIPKSGTYVVQQGDTLYSIAWRYGLDYQDVAQRNAIPKPYHVSLGQKLYLRNDRKSYAIVRETVKPLQSAWQWPARGYLVQPFSKSNKGINILGDYGSPVYAAQAGKVVYSGRRLRGYGNLIILKHNSEFLTAYAHNSQICVQEGQVVKAGQQIAYMGDSDARQVMLHFEIRKRGQPLNPALFLH